VGDHFGPASYGGAGETFEAKSLGWGGFELVEIINKGLITIVADQLMVALSISGTYFATARLATSAVGAVASVTIRWYVVATGAEVAGAFDLSAEKIRVLALGI
jgi:hypothetical protein